MTTADEECNGWCLSAADIGLGEYGSMVAYAHPDCPEHGDPVDERGPQYEDKPSYDLMVAVIRVLRREKVKL